MYTLIWSEWGFFRWIPIGHQKYMCYICKAAVTTTFHSNVSIFTTQRPVLDMSKHLDSHITLCTLVLPIKWWHLMSFEQISSPRIFFFLIRCAQLNDFISNIYVIETIQSFIDFLWYNPDIGSHHKQISIWWDENPICDVFACSSIRDMLLLLLRKKHTVAPYTRWKTVLFIFFGGILKCKYCEANPCTRGDSEKVNQIHMGESVR